MLDHHEAAAAADVEMRWGLQVPMRDGIRLSATAYLPAGKDAAPAIVMLTPYIAQTFHERGTYFAARGFPFVVVDTRGRGNSEGSFRPTREAEDGHDTVEWLAAQPFCSGKVGMWGGSYQGYVQWATAKELPPHLATIVPVAAPYQGLDAPMRNNIVPSYCVQWLHMIAGRASQERIFTDQAFWNRQFRRWFESGTPFRHIDRLLGVQLSVFQEFLAHPELDSYWDGFNPSAEQYSRMDLPVLTITGIYDGDQPGALMHYTQHLRNHPNARHYLIIGPWDHAGTRTPKAEMCGLTLGPDSLLDLPKLHAEWYAWTMQQGPKPAFLRKKVAYYVMVAEQWRYADSLEAVTASVRPFYLDSTTNPSDVFNAGSLLEQRCGTGGPDHYVYDPRDRSLAAEEVALNPDSVVEQRMIHAALGKQLVYHTDPFEDDTEICGFFKLRAWLSIDQPDTDFRVTIYDVGVDGSTVLLTSDVLRARYRQSLRAPQLIQTTEPLLYEFNRFTFAARRMGRRHRLRLVVRPINSIFSQKNYNSGGVVSDESMADARVVTVRMFHDAGHPSALHVPFGATE